MKLRRRMLRRKTDPKTCCAENRKMPDASPAATVLCESAQSKCTWTCQKRHFARKFTGKCRTRIPGPAFCGSLRSQNEHGHVTRAFCAEIYGENAKRFRYTTSIEHRALTLTARTPQCGHTVWGTIQKVHPPTPKKKTHQVQSSISKIALCLWGCLGPG